MGSLIYGSAGIEIAFDDRVLAHLQAVFNVKLRRRQSFFFSWRDDPSVGDGRSAAWIDAGVPLYFRYSGGRQPSLDRDWLEQMVLAADSSRGLVLSDEPGPAGVDSHAKDNSIKRKDHPSV